MPAQAMDRELAALQWKKRVLIAIAPSQQDPHLAAQRRIVEENGAGMSERQLAFYEFAGTDARARAIRQQFGVSDTQFKAVLLGKDGNAALTSPTPLSAEKLFGTIDAMPMRRDEMRRQRN